MFAERNVHRVTFVPDNYFHRIVLSRYFTVCIQPHIIMGNCKSPIKVYSITGPRFNLEILIHFIFQ